MSVRVQTLQVTQPMRLNTLFYSHFHLELLAGWKILLAFLLQFKRAPKGFSLNWNLPCNGNSNPVQCVSKIPLNVCDTYVCVCEWVSEYGELLNNMTQLGRRIQQRKPSLIYGCGYLKLKYTLPKNIILTCFTFAKILSIFMSDAIYMGVVIIVVLSQYE